MDKKLEKDPRLPYYSFDEFLAACEEPSPVMIWTQAQKDADKDFKLRTINDILAFISGGGLEELRFINAKIWEKNPQPEYPIMVDGYEFIAFFVLGYLAFYKSTTGCWVIKSFHRSDEATNVMEIALRKAGCLPGGKDA